MTKRIFITGGTGFFGKSMLDYRLRHPDWEWAKAKAVRATLGLGGEIIVKGTVKPGEQPSCYVPCIERAMNELGCHLLTDVKDAIKRSCEK